MQVPRKKEQGFVPPPPKVRGAATRTMSRTEKKMVENGWNAHALWEHLKKNRPGFEMTYVHLWRLVKGDSPWLDDELRQACGKIVGVEFPRGSSPVKKG